MKKLLCLAFATVCLCACGSKEETKTLSCTIKKEGQGMKTAAKIEYDYKGNSALNQKQNTVMTIESAEYFEQYKPLIEAKSLEEKVKGMDGITYSLKEDAKNFKFTEDIVINFDEVSGDDYKEISGAETSGSTVKIDVDKTQKGFEDQGYTCTK